MCVIHTHTHTHTQYFWDQQMLPAVKCNKIPRKISRLCHASESVPVYTFMTPSGCRSKITDDMCNGPSSNFTNDHFFLGTEIPFFAGPLSTFVPLCLG